MNKHLTLFDTQRPVYKDEANIESFYGKNGLRGEVIFKDIDTGKPIYTMHNKVIIAGSQTVASKLFDLPELVHLPTYNEDLTLDQSQPHETTPENVEKICLFCCGTQGCGKENSQVVPVKYTGRIAPEGDLVPFMYQLPQNDLTAEQREKYFGRKTTADRIAYYFKGFETEPTMHARFVDGTIIDADLYDSQNQSDAELFVEMSLRITKEDFRDYFRATTGINDARINSISLVTAWYTEHEGYKYYQNIKPFTQLNIPNEPLIDLTKGIDITYHIYC